MKIVSLLALGTLVLMSCSQPQSASDSSLAPVSVQSPNPVPSPTPARPLHAKQIDKRWSSEFEFVTKSINSAHTGIRSYKISVDYPEIKERTPQTKRFNNWMRRKMVAEAKKFEWLERRAEIHDRKKKLDPVHITESLETWFDLYYADKRLLSLRLIYSVMALGQMHPINYYETINFDLERGRILTTHDVFRHGYLKVFSQYSRDHVRENYDLGGGLEEQLLEGTEPKGRNFANWNVVPDGILIAFEDYQIASHSFGQLELIIPYAELKSVLRPNRFTAVFNPAPKKSVQNRE